MGTVSPVRARKLTAPQVLEIRRLYATGLRTWSYQTLAKKFGVSKPVIASIVRRRSWEWL